MLFRVCTLCTLVVVSAPVLAQDPTGGNPFDTPGAPPTNPFGNSSPSSDGGVFGDFGQANSPMVPAGAQPGTASDAPDPDPVVRMLRETEPQTPQEMAEGITWMVRIKRWDEVGRLLDLVKAANWNDNSKAELAREAGSAIWLRLRGTEVELSDEQRTLLAEIVSAPSKLARDPKSIDNWIDQLASQSPSQRRLAQLRLQDSSMAGVARLLSRLLDGDTRVPSIMLAATIIEFGRDGEDALRAACMVADPDRASRVFLNLAKLPGRQFSAELGAALENRLLPEATIQELKDLILKKHGGVPTADKIQDYMAGEFGRRLEAYQRARVSASSFSTVVWKLTADRNSVELVEGPSHHRELEMLTQIAVLRLRLNALSPEDAATCQTVVLQRAYQSSPEISTGEIQSQIVTADNSARTPNWQRVFEKAGRLQMHSAALRSLQMLTDQSVESDASLNFLSDLLRDTRPMIRYTALQSIARIDPTMPYRGSDKAVETALEMSRLDGGARALVIGLHSDLRQAAQQQLQLHTGAPVATANSARSALQILNRDEPFELIFIVDRVADQSIFELLQRLRNSKKAHALPIGILTDDLYPHERRLVDETPGVVSSVLTRNPEQMGRVIVALLDSLDTQPMSMNDRAEFSITGAEFLAKITGDREQYAFYPVDNWGQHLTSVATNLPSASRTRLLSGLGSSDSQFRLVQLASNGSLAASERENAARAFGVSIKRSGLRLSRGDVAACYELYNQLGPTDPTAAKALGLVLDVIEAHAGKAAWPEGF